MGRTYKEYLNEKLKDPEIKKEWDELEPEFQLIRMMIKARDERHLSQRQLSDMTGITQADISKMESGEANPTLQTLKRVAEGLGMKLELVFTPLTGMRNA